jgi:hypothetical protein
MERTDLSNEGSGERRAIQGIVSSVFENNFTPLGSSQRGIPGTELGEPKREINGFPREKRCVSISSPDAKHRRQPQSVQSGEAKKGSECRDTAFSVSVRAPQNGTVPTCRVILPDGFGFL